MLLFDCLAWHLRVEAFQLAVMYPVLFDLHSLRKEDNLTYPLTLLPIQNEEEQRDKNNT